MTKVLVTGGTGHLGRPTVERLRAAGQDVRVLSRRSGPGLHTGDLRTGAGVREALHDVHTLVHLATGRGDVAAARDLFAAAKSAGVAHVVLISIVGVDRIPLAYYRGKVAIERMLAVSGIPFTIQRATQFHYLVELLFSAQRFLPVTLAPAFSFQPIDTRDVADRLVELTLGAPQGLVPDIGGPETLSAAELGAVWAAARDRTRPIWRLRLPGKTIAAYTAGGNLVPGDPVGRISFADYLAESAAVPG
ncbi:SDR family oxidoreductase [Glaciibacter sp. 2TAF33]|uniref:SDR family oxidoreductase n=1 Tax=Glaciibacter sp. 2TAF33 TaxID=3233015 RepID=UPI003F8F3E65